MLVVSVSALVVEAFDPKDALTPLGIPAEVKVTLPPKPLNRLVVIYLTQVDTICSIAGYGRIPAEPERI